METLDYFKNSPMHDKSAILNLMDGLYPSDMVDVIEFIQKTVRKNYVATKHGKI